MIRIAVAWLVSCCAVPLLAQAPQRDQPRVRRAGDSAIAGIVVSDEREPRPLRRARVTLSGGGLANEFAITKDDGTFEFAGLPAGRYTVTASKDPYVPMTYGARRPWFGSAALIDIAPGETKKIGIRLPKGAVITGVVTDPDGQPVIGVTVHAFTFRYLAGGGERRLVGAGVPPASTDAHGVYRIFGLPAGDYVVGTDVRRAEAVETLSPADVRAALAEARSPRTGTRRIPSTLTPRPTLSAPRSVVMAPVYYPGTAFASRAALVSVSAGDERSGIDFQVAPVAAATVSGSLPSQPRPVVTLLRRDQYLPAEGIRRSTVDSFGRFSFEGVVPGQYTISAIARPNPPPGPSQEPVQWASSDITVDGEDVLVALSLQHAISITGRIVWQGSSKTAPTLPLTDIPLPIASLNGAPSPHVRMEPDGTFTIRGVVPGGYRIGAIRGVRSPVGVWWLKSIVSGGRDLLDAPLDVRETMNDVVVTFAESAGLLYGRVTDAAGAPSTNGHAIVFGSDRQTWFHGSRRVAGVQPDADGQYSIRNLPPGQYFLTFDDNVYPNEWFDPAVLDRLIPGALRLTLLQDERRSQNLVSK